MDSNWFNIVNVSEADTPFLAIFPERVKANIRALKKLIPDNTRLRPHVKTIKCKQAIVFMLEAGISKFKCATIAEAEMLALSGAGDVLLAYQPVGPKIKRFINLVTNYPATSFSCLVENMEIAEELASRALVDYLYIKVYLDLNVGMNRTGIAPSQALEIYKAISGLRGVTLMGLHAYDGHITDTNFENRKSQYQEAFNTVEDLREEIIKSGLSTPDINSGSTPTIKLHAGNPGVECSPGTFIYWDQWYEELYSELPFKPAVILVTRVISKTSDHTFCLDLGYKAVSSEDNMEKRVHFLNIPGIEIISQSEEHMMIKVNEPDRVKIGDVLYGIPYHIGRTCNLYQCGLTIDNHRIDGQWIYFTGRKITV